MTNSKTYPMPFPSLMGVHLRAKDVIWMMVRSCLKRNATLYTPTSYSGTSSILNANKVVRVIVVGSKQGQNAELKGDRVVAC